MSHHFDTPTAKDDPRINVCDLYLFRGAPGTTVMAMTVNPDADLSAPDTFRPEGLYAFRFDLTGNMREEVTFKVPSATFATMTTTEARTGRAFGCSGRPGSKRCVGCRRGPDRRGDRRNSGSIRYPRVRGPAPGSRRGGRGGAARLPGPVSRRAALPPGCVPALTRLLCPAERVSNRARGAQSVDRTRGRSCMGDGLALRPRRGGAVQPGRLPPGMSPSSPDRSRNSPRR